VKENKDRTLVKKEWLETRATRLEKVVIDRVDILDKIRKSKAVDNEIVEKMKKAKVKVLRDEE